MSEELSGLACDSEAYWGYDKNYMDQFRRYYNVTADFIRSNPVRVLKEGDRTVGFFGLQSNESNWQLEFFYVCAASIGKGYGRNLWNELLAFCREERIGRFEFVTSPQAVPFYEKMGARVVGEEASLLKKGRTIPKLLYSLEE
ncbi:GNAT family N-acetyltransferase [Caproiciproducens sp. NJN-50]|nr:GNAT family N-acetyltransferase [Caproiciproducens sp. NJN-50]